MLRNNVIRHGVGLLILTDLPKIGRVAVLQVRGYFNTEEMRPQYYAGGCQVTVYGGINKGENLKQALMREIREELGPDIASLVRSVKIVKISEFKRANEEGKIYAAFLNSGFLKKIRLGPDSGGIRLVKPDELKSALDLSKYKSGVKNRSVLAVFPDMRKTLTAAFNVFKNRKFS